MRTAKHALRVIVMVVLLTGFVYGCARDSSTATANNFPQANVEN